MSGAGYASRQAWIEDHLFAARMRIRAAAEQLQHWTTGHIGELPPDLAEHEAQIAARVRCSNGLPLVELCERFSLTTEEQRLLWILIAHALCPIARNLLRNLSTEDALEPTTDVIHRVVLGIRFEEEVLDPDGVLVRFGLVERADQDALAPEHRQTWKVSRRVLALVRGRLELDRALAEVAVVEDMPAHLDELDAMCHWYQATSKKCAPNTTAIAASGVISPSSPPGMPRLRPSSTVVRTPAAMASSAITPNGWISPLPWTWM